MAGGEQPGRVRDLDDAGLDHLEAADLVGRSVPVLGRPHHAEPGVTVALEREHDVDEVLQEPGPGDRAVLRHVADDHRGHAAPLRHPHQRAGHLAHLRDAARGTVGFGRADGLYGVDHQQGRRDLLDVAEHCAEVGLGGQEQVVGDVVRARRPKPYLRRRLLARHVQGATALSGPSRRNLQQQRGLPDARLAGQKGDGTRYEPATEHSIQLAHAGEDAIGRPLVDLADRYGTAHGCRGCHLLKPWRLSLGDAAPGQALATTADPAHRRPATLGAPICRPRLLSHGRDSLTPRRQFS